MAIEVDGKTIETNEKGYLVNVEDWNEGVAQAIAEQESLTLTDKHWDLIKFLRDEYFNNAGSQPNTRTIVKAMREKWPGETVDQNAIYKLFPLDPSKQGARVAGLPESRRKGGY